MHEKAEATWCGRGAGSRNAARVCARPPALRRRWAIYRSSACRCSEPTKAVAHVYDPPPSPLPFKARPIPRTKQESKGRPTSSLSRNGGQDNFPAPAAPTPIWCVCKSTSPAKANRHAFHCRHLPSKIQASRPWMGVLRGARRALQARGTKAPQREASRVKRIAPKIGGGITGGLPIEACKNHQLIHAFCWGSVNHSMQAWWDAGAKLVAWRCTAADGAPPQVHHPDLGAPAASRQQPRPREPAQAARHPPLSWQEEMFHAARPRAHTPSENVAAPVEAPPQ